MIEELHIRHLGVIEEVRLELAPGLTVVTGETGAGKTMLVTALQLLLGARADTALVRAGARSASIDALVSPVPAGARDYAEDGEDVLVVSREIPADGRSRARVAGRPVAVGVLDEVLGADVEVHAQHEHVRLGRPDVQRGLLDRYAGPDHAALLAEHRDAHERHADLVERLARRHEDGRARLRDLETLRSEVAEIDAAALDPDVDDRLDEALERLANADEIHRTAAEAQDALGADRAGEAVGVALDALRRLDLEDTDLTDLRERTQAIAAELQELARDVRAYGEAVDADPAGLAALQERKHTVVGLTRRYGADVAAVLAHAAAARTRIAALEAEERDGEDLEALVEEAADRRTALAERLRAGRRAAAAALRVEVDGHLADLGMGAAHFDVEVAPRTDGHRAHGADEVRFVLAPNPGEPARPLGQGASGGERSRVALAIEVALADAEEARVLVFDEVDAGIGGATAMAVGEKLARLAAGARQVLCVTHLPQLAAFADVHHVVDKTIVDGRTVTTARRVAADERAGELARMLGGDARGAAGLAHAEDLLGQAAARRG